MPTSAWSLTSYTAARAAARLNASSSQARRGLSLRPCSASDAMEQRDDPGYRPRRARDQDSASHTRTGFHIRARMQSALESGSNYVNAAMISAAERTEEQRTYNTQRDANPQRTAVAQPTPSSSRSKFNSYDEDAPGRPSLTRTFRSKSASLLSAAAAGIDRSLAPSPASQRSFAESTTGSIASSETSQYKAYVSGDRRRQIVGKMKASVPSRSHSTYAPSYSSKGVNNDEYRKHNLFPLPPPGHVSPILLPTYAIRKEASARPEGGGHKRYDIDVRIDGFVEQWPDRVGTLQRIFMQSARQLANLPRLQRQQPAPYHRHPTSTEEREQAESSNAAATGEAAGLTPLYIGNLSSSPGQSVPTTPLHADTDDATFFPETPSGVTSQTGHSSDDDGSVASSGVLDHALSHGAPDRAIGKVLQKLGALPLEDQVHEGWQQSVEDAAAQVQQDEVRAAEAGAKHKGPTAPVGPLGGAAFWANRTHEEIEKLWRTLEHRLRCFWTYRKPFQDVVIEIVPVFRGDDSQRDISWIANEYGVEQATNAQDLPPLLALTDVRSDSQGLFSTIVTISKDKIEHYLAHISANDTTADSKRGVHDIIALRMRARLASAGGHHNTTAAVNAAARQGGASTVAQATTWQMLRISDDSPSTVHIICDIDDTSKHTHVLGGVRAVTRNVFARPFEEVTVPGVKEWFERLSPAWRGQETNADSECQDADVHGGHVAVSGREHGKSGALINHFHYVTNAPAEMHAIIKAYMSTAELPAGTLLLKHYFSSGRSSSKSNGSTGGGGVMAWLQTYREPPSERKRQNLLRCLDDFPHTFFCLVGDSGEMDIEVYSELAAERPHQVRAVWIRNVGNISQAAQRLVEDRASNRGKPEKAKNRDSYPPTSLGNTNAAPNAPDESLSRIQKAIRAMPATINFMLWRTGYDIVDESVQGDLCDARFGRNRRRPVVARC